MTQNTRCFQVNVLDNPQYTSTNIISMALHNIRDGSTRWELKTEVDKVITLLYQKEAGELFLRSSLCEDCKTSKNNLV